MVGGKMVGEDSNMRAGFVVFAAAEAMIFWIMLQGLMCFECKIQDEEHSCGWWSDKGLRGCAMRVVIGRIVRKYADM